MRRVRNGIGYHPELDGIRAVAVLAVFLFHTKLAWFPQLEADGGLLGVDLFFVLSGFLITTLLTEEHGATGQIRRVAFYGRRALRLVPALVVALLLGAVVVHYYGNRSDTLSYPWSAAVALLFAGNWFGSKLGVLGHTWSLGVEQQYYLFWPLVLSVALYRGARLHRLAASIAGVAVLVAAFRGSFSRSLLTMPFGDPRAVLRVDGVLLGSALALFLASSRREHAVRLLRDRALAGAAFVCAAAIAAWAARPDLRTYDSILAIDACFVLLIGHVFINKESRLSRLLRAQPLRGIGKISYGLYLFHWPLFIATRHLFGRSVTAAVAGWVSAFALALLSYELVERPALELKARLRRSRRRPERVSRLDAKGAESGARGSRVGGTLAADAAV